jgi:cyanate permease
VVGIIKDQTGSFAGGLYALAGFALLSAIVTVIGVPARRARSRIGSAAHAPAE